MPNENPSAKMKNKWITYDGEPAVELRISDDDGKTTVDIAGPLFVEFTSFPSW
jgi:hypothetical protein